MPLHPCDDAGTAKQPECTSKPNCFESVGVEAEEEWQKIPSSSLAFLSPQRSVQQRLEVMSEEELPKGAWPCGACFVFAFS